MHGLISQHDFFLLSSLDPAMMTSVVLPSYYLNPKIRLLDFVKHFQIIAHCNQSELSCTIYLSRVVHDNNLCTKRCHGSSDHESFIIRLILSSNRD